MSLPNLRDSAALALTEHPNLKVALRNDDERQALVIQGIDVTIWFGKLDHSIARAKHLADSPRGIVASSEYLAQY
ncbi:LysR substrate-binding domain-containing protein [Teredinibacter turnerae]|uniref:LysR substrate-binding domain-containing protein n=1 Tax=Teredinibacter turnerae TaxID=2426 RepID=UPI000AC5EA57|nr:LysR substrate-binding domain-containing protein [Teredinibacter turnerae]